MKKSLFVTEKPSVAMDYVKLLGVKGVKNDGYIEGDNAVFTWCVGHLITMSYPEAYDEKLKKWSLNTLPFLPKEYKYEIIQAVSKQFNILSNLLKRNDIKTIYVCTDSGREGEYIYRLVDQMVGVKDKEKKRVWIDSQTEEEIRRGIKEAKDLSEFDSLADSAYLRAKEDYLLGINFSRLLTLLYGKTISNVIKEEKVVVAVGRVMSCVLGMVVDREREIRDFVKTPFYKIEANFTTKIHGENNSFTYIGEWKAIEDSKYFQSTLLYNENGFKEKYCAEEFVKDLEIDLQRSKAVVYQINKSSENKNPPLLFNLAELQNECSKRFKINPDKTLNKIQLLYEKKMLTYPRTDARVLSKAVAKEINNNIKKLTLLKNNEIKVYAENILNNAWYKNIHKTKYVDDSKITDHYAIIPTGEGLNNYDSLNDLEKNIYNLVVRRFLAIFYPPAKYKKISIITKIGKESFFTMKKICIEKGYLNILNPEKNEKDENNIELLNKLKKGQTIDTVQLNIKDGETTPPKRYTTGSIIIAMENAGKFIEDEELREQIKGAGIGTSATRAEILKKLEKIQYINSNKKNQIITPTVKGEMIYEVIKISIPSLLNPRLTASWEKGLKMVYERDILSKAFMDKLEEYIKSNTHKLLNTNNVISTESLFSKVIKNNNIEIDKEKNDEILGICPFCHRGQIVRNSKGYGCSNWKNGCKFFIGKICGKKISSSQIRKLIKNGETDIVNGFKSKKGTEFESKLILTNGKIQFKFEK